MASPSKVVKHGLLDYPSIFPDVGEVLHQLFLVNGNGFDWVKGELVDEYSEVDYDNLNVKKIARSEIRKMKENYDSIPCGDTSFPTNDAQKLVVDREVNNYKFTVKNIDRLCTMENITKSHFKGELYPLCGKTDGSSEYPNVYQKLFNVPVDVTNDWLEVAYKFAENMQYEMRCKMQSTTSPELIAYKEEFDAVAIKLDNMMIKRGMRATHVQRKKNMDEVMKMLKDEKVITD
jgi:hypothetical protein